MALQVYLKEMKNKFLLIVIIGFFIFTFLIFFKSLRNSNIYEPNVMLDKEIPIFNASIFDSGKIINSNKIFEKKNFYLMNIWSSWCIPCREEHKFLVKLKDKKDLKIIGLNYKDKKENAKKFLNDFSNPYNLIFSDKSGTIAIEWGAYGVPETFLIYQKKIIKKFVGPLNQESLLEIQKIIK